MSFQFCKATSRPKLFVPWFRSRSKPHFFLSPSLSKAPCCFCCWLTTSSVKIKQALTRSLSPVARAEELYRTLLQEDKLPTRSLNSLAMSGPSNPRTKESSVFIFHFDSPRKYDPKHRQQDGAPPWWCSVGSGPRLLL
jgi:hypothetical protein